MNEVCTTIESSRIHKYKMMRKLSLALLFGILLSTSAYAQDTLRDLTGVVYNEEDSVMAGVTVIVDKSTRGVLTAPDGTFTIKVSPDDVLVLNSLGYEPERIVVGSQTHVIVKMRQKIDELEEVTVVGFARQRKESVIASVATIKPDELHVPSSNFTQGIAGRMAGVISYQSSGEPGKDNLDFFIRGVTTFGYSASPLILIDNIESSTQELGQLSVDDVAAFSIMKDATATSIYGARGANGVILVTTKEGREGPAKLSLRFENSVTTPSRNIELVDPVTYMKMYNEALVTRNPDALPRYSQAKIAGTQLGMDPYLYPSVDWYDELFNKVALSQRANVNISGGGGVAKYYISASFNNDNGLLQVDKKNNYNNNINIKTIQVRTNVNINLTKTTRVDVRLNASFQDYNGPIDGGDVMYRKVRAASPVDFPKTYAPDEANQQTAHILYGNVKEWNYLNPYADMTKGYRQTYNNNVTAQVELTQDLKFITKGLNIRVLANSTRPSAFSSIRATEPFYYDIGYYDPATKKYTLNQLNPDYGREDLNLTKDGPYVNIANYFEGSITYNRDFGKHTVGALLVGTMRNYVPGNETEIHRSLPSRNMGLSGRVTYAFDSRYFFEANFGYNGSERFAKKERFGFFPSAGIGYIISNEPFWPKNMVVDRLKLKATYGLVGNDRIGSERDRFYYLSVVSLNAGISPISFGENFTEGMQTIGISRYGNSDITWEVARKMDIGVEMTLFNFLELQMDYFNEKRSSIFQTRPNIPAEAGYAAGLVANVGRASSSGFEIQADANKSVTKDIWLGLRGNFTFARSKYDYKEELNYPYAWLGETGRPIGQTYGYIAERLFVDEADIANSPKQSFGDYMPGDIKYRDINGDDIIDGNDVVPVGYPSVPEIMYGFGISFGYKNFDISCFFQGAARSSFYIDAMRTAPFLNASTFSSDEYNMFGGKVARNHVLKTWGNSYWSESNRDNFAAQPRLTTEAVNNNLVSSTWWLRDGSYMRLKSVEVGYTFSSKALAKAKIKNLRIYASGLNLALFSKFKEWDVEQGGNGFNYPIQAVYNLGLHVNF